MMTPTPPFQQPNQQFRSWNISNQTVETAQKHDQEDHSNPMMGRPYRDALTAFLIFFAYNLCVGGIFTLITTWFPDSGFAKIYEVKAYSVGIFMCVQFALFIPWFAWWANRLDRRWRPLVGWYFRAIDLAWGTLGLIVPRVILIGAIIIMGGPPEDMSKADQALLSPGMSPLMLASAFVGIVIVAPIFEELIFRGIMLRAMARRMPGWLAVVLSGTIFGLLHAGNYTGLSWGTIIFALTTTVTLGITLSALTQLTGRLSASIVGHILNNSLVFVVYMFTQN